MSTVLSKLGALSQIVADTGNLSSIKSIGPIDATTNPSLILQAAQQGEQAHLLLETIKAMPNADSTGISQALLVRFAVEISKMIPGRVSIEVDARLSYNLTDTIAYAKQLVGLANQAGLSNDRLLIKIAATWQGIQAARHLEAEGIQCNLTLVFCAAQAVACANANIFLISPFVGRILDWYKANRPDVSYTTDNDPGVMSVKHIYNLLKRGGSKTIVMGASFRSASQVLALAGCDKLTISPSIISELKNSDSAVPQALCSADLAINLLPTLTAAQFRTQLDGDKMASDKLAEGIRQFVKDQQALESLITTLKQQHEVPAC